MVSSAALQARQSMKGNMIVEHCIVKVRIIASVDRSLMLRMRIHCTCRSKCRNMYMLERQLCPPMQRWCGYGSHVVCEYGRLFLACDIWCLKTIMKVNLLEAIPLCCIVFGTPCLSSWWKGSDPLTFAYYLMQKGGWNQKWVYICHFIMYKVAWIILELKVCSNIYCTLSICIGVVHLIGRSCLILFK